MTGGLTKITRFLGVESWNGSFFFVLLLLCYISRLQILISWICYSLHPTKCPNTDFDVSIYVYAMFHPVSIVITYFFVGDHQLLQLLVTARQLIFQIFFPQISFPDAPCREYLPTWNLFVLYFGGWTLQNKVFCNQNKGHLGSRYMYIHLS